MNFDKPKNQLPKVEELVLNKGYAFTYNPSQQDFGDAERMKKRIRAFRHRFNHGCLRYRTYVEISCVGRIHFHGYLWISDARQFYEHVVHDLIDCGTLVVKEVFDEGEWENYIIKQCAVLKLKALTKEYELQTAIVKSTNIDYFL